MQWKTLWGKERKMSTEKTRETTGSVEEKVISGRKMGAVMLCVIILMFAAATALYVIGGMRLGKDEAEVLGNALMVLATVLVIAGVILCPGLKVIHPQEALVLTLFGQYYGTLKDTGFYFVNPFCTAMNPAAGTRLGQSGDINDKGAAAETKAAGKRISLKIMTLSNSRQKINDYLGNPVEISVAVIWQVENTAKAVFAVDNYKEYLSLQCDAAVRNIVRLYPYDVAPNVDTTGDGKADDGSLRGSSDVVAKRICDEIQSKVENAGLKILDARITYLAYAPEIAGVMLQRQQASAVIDARKMIVDGAVGMVEMALERLKEDDVVDLDPERKAAMVSNLLVVLCGNHDSQPVVNAGSLY